MPRFSLFLLATVLAVIHPLALSAQKDDGSGDLRRRIVERYADHAGMLYARVVEKTRALERNVLALIARPSEESMAAAKKSWIAAHVDYSLTEAFRFYDGPIDNGRDGVENLVNAWPIDESYIDYVRGAPESGIINKDDLFPNLSPTILMLASERGGETNISVGWHAAEFLLFGQDFSDAGPGDRSYLDYVPGKSKNAERRGKYLKSVVELLLEHLTKVRDAWAPQKDNYRRKFESTPDASIKKILTGMTILSGFEMAGERMATGFETRDQEEEHSCFSDVTLSNLIADEEGIIAAFRGGFDGDEHRIGVKDLGAKIAPEIAADLEKKLQAALACLRAIPGPFDRAIRAADDSPERRALKKAIEALEAQTESIATLALMLGHEVPLKPKE